MSTPKAPKPTPPATPAALAGKAHHPVKVAVASDATEKEIEAASKYGKVEDGSVYVTRGKESFEIGEAQGEEPLLPYIKRYFEHLAELDRFKARLEVAELSVRDIDGALRKFQGLIDKPDFVGSVAGFEKRLKTIAKEATGVRERIEEKREADREAAVISRTAIVDEAEKLAGKPVAKIHWKNDTARLRELFDEWQAAQKDGTRIPKDVEKDLWKRFSAARTSFEKARKAHFADLDKVNTEVAGKKEALAARAEAIQASTDWDKTAREFRDLMTQWKASGRGRRSVDDALWKRFQTAQDAFFDARRSASDAEDEALAGNVEPKEKAVKEAEAILPITDVRAAKNALRIAQDHFEAAGRVPRGDVKRLSDRMGKVERAVREAEDKAWTSSNPELEARVSGATAQLVDALAAIDEKIAKAKAAGDDRKVKDLEAERAAKQAWLEQLQVSS